MYLRSQGNMAYPAKLRKGKGERNQMREFNGLYYVKQ